MGVDPVAVLGAGGPTGVECVRELLAEGHRCRAVVRDPSKYQGNGTFPEHKNLTIVKGDVTDRASLEPALRGCKSAIFAASVAGYWGAWKVDCEVGRTLGIAGIHTAVETCAHCQGVANAASVAKEVGVEQMALVSSRLVEQHNWLVPLRFILNTVKWGLMDAKLEGERRLRRVAAGSCTPVLWIHAGRGFATRRSPCRESGLPYTIVRPGGLKNNGGGSELVVGQGDKEMADPRAGRTISRNDVARCGQSPWCPPEFDIATTLSQCSRRVCIAALSDKNARGKTFEVVATKEPSKAPSNHYASLFQRLALD